MAWHDSPHPKNSLRFASTNFSTSPPGRWALMSVNIFVRRSLGVGGWEREAGRSIDCGGKWVRGRLTNARRARGSVMAELIVRLIKPRQPQFRADSVRTRNITCTGCANPQPRQRVARDKNIFVASGKPRAHCGFRLLHRVAAAERGRGTMRSMVEGAAIRAMHASGPTIVQDQKIASYDSDPKLFR